MPSQKKTKNKLDFINQVQENLKQKPSNNTFNWLDYIFVSSLLSILLIVSFPTLSFLNHQLEIQKPLPQTLIID